MIPPGYGKSKRPRLRRPPFRYLIVPAIYAEEWMDAGILTDKEKSVYVRICFREYNYGKQTPITQEELAAQCRTSRITVNKAINRLLAFGLIQATGSDKHAKAYRTLTPHNLFGSDVKLALLPRPSDVKLA